MTKASIILLCLFCLNVTQWLLCRCVHSHTTHRLAALQIVNASSHPISTVREIQFEDFYYSTVAFSSLRITDFWHRPSQFATTLQRVLTECIQQHIYQSYFKLWISNDGSSNPALIVTVRVGASINEWLQKKSQNNLSACILIAGESILQKGKCWNCLWSLPRAPCVHMSNRRQIVSTASSSSRVLRFLPWPSNEPPHVAFDWQRWARLVNELCGDRVRVV